ncbi:MAG: 50S ribosomal protein L28 [Bacteroidota bacterium]|nr:50S ribosomal protein L28 [Bacteroidota bacterium]
MSRVCEITGKKAIVGNKVSHSNAKTKRKFNVNLQVKKFYLPEEDKWITMRISTSALKTINKNGITAVVKKARTEGFLKKKK